MEGGSELIKRTSIELWRRHWELPALAILVIAVYFLRMAAIPVCGEESRWATAAREMLASGDWVTPRQQGTIFPERPPLGSWVMAAVGWWRGEVDLYAIRLPSAVATLFMVLGIFLYAARWLSRGGALAAAASYATFGQVMQIGRMGESESLFTLFVAGSLLAWHAVYLAKGPHWLAWSLGYGLAALGALVKGPQAPIYFVAVTGVFLLADRNWRWLITGGHLCGIGCFLAIVGAWFVPFAWWHWTAVDDIWAGLAKDRFTWSGLVRHVASYPLETFGCLLPWSPLLAALLHPRIARTLWNRHASMKFLVLALAVTYPSVLLAAGARGRYYMPLYPCIALLIGIVVDYCGSRLAPSTDQRFWRQFQWSLAMVIAVLGMGVALAGIIPLQPARQLSQSPGFLMMWVPGTTLCMALLVWAAWRGSERRTPVSVAAIAGFLALAHTGLYMNQRVRGANDLSPAVAELKHRVLQGELVSLGRVYHRFAYFFDEPIRQVNWPSNDSDVPADVEYFCFDRRPGDTPECRSASDGRIPLTTPGTLPFEWEEILEIPCDPANRAIHNRTVVIGRRKRTVENQTTPSEAAAVLSRAAGDRLQR